MCVIICRTAICRRTQVGQQFVFVFYAPFASPKLLIEWNKIDGLEYFLNEIFHEKKLHLNRVGHHCNEYVVF